MIKRGKDEKSYHAVVALHIVAPDGGDLEWSNLLLGSRYAFPYNVWRKKPDTFSLLSVCLRYPLLQKIRDCGAKSWKSNI